MENGQLAKRGMSIVLISRNLSLLHNVATEIKEKYNRETIMIDVDFTKLDIYERIESELENLEIGVLINNVGMGVPYGEYLNDYSEKFLKDQINCNIVSATLMSKIVLPGMKKRNKGMIVNISSYSSMIPCCLTCTYGATKAYMNMLSRSMSVELQDTGVQVQCLCPALIKTKFINLNHTSRYVVSPEGFVKAALASCGVERFWGGYYYHNYQLYKLEIWRRYLPYSLLNKLSMQGTIAYKTKYLQKMEERNCKLLKKDD